MCVAHFFADLFLQDVQVFPGDNISFHILQIVIQVLTHVIIDTHNIVVYLICNAVDFFYDRVIGELMAGSDVVAGWLKP